MKATGDRESFDDSITTTCFPATVWPSPRTAGDEWQAVSAASDVDADMRRLLEMERACGPVPTWARQVARQIGNLPPCGGCLLQAVEAICKNIGAADGDAAHPHGCHRVGPHQMQLMSDYAVCLGGWLRGANPETVAADTSEKSLGWRDWELIAKRIGESLGEPTEAKVLLVRRLIAHLRRPSLPASPPAEASTAAAGDAGPAELPAEGRPAWRPAAADKPDPALAEMDAQIRRDVQGAESWLGLIDAAWPCAPRPFHFLERIVAAIGQIGLEGAFLPADPGRVSPGQPPKHPDGLSLDSQRNSRLFDATVRALQDFLAAARPAARRADAGEDEAWADDLTDALGKPAPVKAWLAAVLLERIRMCEESFKCLRVIPALPMLPNPQKVT
jgi:hypothetical protein